MREPARSLRTDMRSNWRVVPKSAASTCLAVPRWPFPSDRRSPGNTEVPLLERSTACCCTTAWTRSQFPLPASISFAVHHQVAISNMMDALGNWCLSGYYLLKSHVAAEGWAINLFGEEKSNNNQTRAIASDESIEVDFPTLQIQQRGAKIVRAKTLEISHTGIRSVSPPPPSLTAANRFTINFATFAVFRSKVLDRHHHSDLSLPLASQQASHRSIIFTQSPGSGGLILEGADKLF